MTTALQTWLRSQPDRCGSCGWHIATMGHGPACSPTAPADEWSLFKAAVRAAVRDDGTVHQSDVRPRIRGRIEPKHIGQLWRRARSEGLVRDTGEREQSDDVAGRNADKLDRIYALGRAA